MRKQKIAKSFGNNRSYYDEHANIQKQVAPKLADLLPAITAPKILEIGCGTGFLTRILFEKYPDGIFHITDLSPDMVEYCQRKHPHNQATFFQMDGENTNCDNEYDLIVSAMTFQWFNAPMEALDKLSQKGDVYYSSLGSDNFKEWRNALKQNNLSDGTIPTIEWPNIISEEHIKESHDSGKSFLNSLKQIGVATPSVNYKNLNHTNLKRALSAFDGDITWHIVYGSQPRK